MDEIKELQNELENLRLLKEGLELAKLRFELIQAKESYIKARKRRYFEKFEEGYLDPEFAPLEDELKPIFEEELEANIDEPLHIRRG